MGKLGQLLAWLPALLVGVLLIPLFPLHVSSALADSSSTPPLTADDDGFIQPNNTTGGTAATILLKNATAGASAVTSSYNRVGYARFTYDPNYVWTTASFEMVVSSNSDGASNNGWNRTYTSFNIDVYGLSDASWNDSTLLFTTANDASNPWESIRLQDSLGTRTMPMITSVRSPCQPVPTPLATPSRWRIKNS